MNRQRRKELNAIVNNVEETTFPTDTDTLESIRSEIESVLSDEEYAFECMPEGLQYSMRGEASQEAQDNMREAIDTIEDFISEFDEIMKSEDAEERFDQMISTVSDDLTLAAE